MAKAKKKRTKKQNWLMYESRNEELAPQSIFIKRIIVSLLVALGVIAFGLSIGICGYHFIAGYNFVDSLLEASMILGGMGPVRELPDDASKVFASVYALFSGVVVIALMGIMLAPVAHRVMHKFHIDEKDVE